MGLCDVMPYFREKLCSQGYKEYDSELESDDVPKTIAEKSFKMDLGNITAGASRHTSFQFLVPVELVLYFHTYLNKAKGVDEAVEKVDDILALILDESSRYGSSLKAIEPTSILFEAVDESNDNTLRCVLDFDVKLELEYKQ